MSVLEKLLPPQILTLTDVLGKWLSNSGMHDDLEQNKHVFNSIRTKVNGKDAFIFIGVRYATAEEIQASDELIASGFVDKEPENTEKTEEAK